MGFMEPQAEHMHAWHVDTMTGGEIVPADLVGMLPTADGLQDYLDAPALTDDDGNLEMTLETGWYARLSAPGYLDCTDWHGPEPTEEAALAALAEALDACPTCFEQCWDGPNPCEQGDE